MRSAGDGAAAELRSATWLQVVTARERSQPPHIACALQQPNVERPCGKEGCGGKGDEECQHGEVPGTTLFRGSRKKKITYNSCDNVQRIEMGRCGGGGGGGGGGAAVESRKWAGLLGRAAFLQLLVQPLLEFFFGRAM